jgi:hypothetical protein
MKTLVIAKVPTHHNSTSLRNLNLENYKTFPTGVHLSYQDFKTIKEAKESLKNRDIEGVESVQFLTGYDRLEYADYNYLTY